MQFTIFGFNWPTNQSVFLTWQGTVESVISAPHSSTFVETWTKVGLSGSPGNQVQYQVAAQTTSFVDTEIFEVPCDNATPPPLTSTPTSTPEPSDLIIVGVPQLISTPPITAYQPVEYSIVVSNTGGIDVNSQFFVDLYFNPSPKPKVGTDIRIPITQSVGYGAISSLPSGGTKVITITAPLGFPNNPNKHDIYGMVDSIEQVIEGVETNNISNNASLTGVIDANTPTPSPTPGSGPPDISGEVRSLIRNWVRQARAVVKLWSGGNVVATTISDSNGFYAFPSVAPGTYTVTACVLIDTTNYLGQRTGISPPNLYANIFMLPTSGGCP